MNTLVRLNKRLDPSAAIFPRHLDDLFAGFLSQSPSEARRAAAPIRIDVSEDASAYRVSALLPGVKKEDIHIEVDQNEVSIVADIKRELAAPIEPGKEASTNEERVLHSERYYGKASRVFSVAQDIDETAVEAKFADGVLSLLLPKKAPVTAKRVNIQ